MIEETSLTLNHWIIAPIVLPALMAVFMVLAVRHDLAVQRILGLVATGALLVIALVCFGQASTGAIQSYELGAWPAPFGIVLVLDRLASLMVLLTAVLAVVVLLYVVASGWDRRGRHFHALFQFQLMGLMGAMVTGDIFNLFVFFEILLIASYALMVHGGGAQRLRAGVQYVVYNLAGSTLFLFAVGVIYATLGSLNMADLALRAQALPASEAALLRVGVALLLFVFLVKGALIPVHFWLPNTYTMTPAPVAALFAIMTKVGAYAIIRVWTLVFPTTLGTLGDIAKAVLIPGGLATLVVGSLGVLAGGSLARMAAFAAIGSMGTLFVAIGSFTPEALSAALYYLIHSTLAGAALFLLVDQLRARRSSTALVIAPPVPESGLLAAFFFVAAIAVVGLPPLSGFIGKLLVLEAMLVHPLWVWIWAIILGASLLGVVGFARAGSLLFWKPFALSAVAEGANGRGRALFQERHIEPPGRVSAETTPLPSRPALATAGVLLGGTVALSVFAGPVMAVLDATSAQLLTRRSYVEAVLRDPALWDLLPVSPAEIALNEAEAARADALTTNAAPAATALQAEDGLFPVTPASGGDER